MVPELVRLKNDLETIHSPLLENLMLYFTELYTNNRQVRDIVTLAFPNIHSVSIYKRRERASRILESTVVDISIPPPSFKAVFVVFFTYLLYSKTPQTSLF